MWETVGKEKAASIGKEGGSKAATEVAHFWFKRLNTRTFLKLIELFGKYTKFSSTRLNRETSESTRSPYTTR